MADILAPPGGDNCRTRPLSGYHFKVGVTRTNGDAVWFGGFQSLTLSIRNATETYLTLGERIPMFLDGEIQIAWVLEKGMVDGDFLNNVFGITSNYIGRGKCECIPETPRFTISFTSNCKVNYTDSTSEGFLGISDAEYFDFNNSNNRGINSRFQINILYCKVDNMSLGLMPGRRVAAERWEGVAEGIRKIDIPNNAATNNTGILNTP